MLFLFSCLSFFYILARLLCSRTGTLAFHLLDELRLFGSLCFTVCYHTLCVSVG